MSTSVLGGSSPCVKPASLTSSELASEVFTTRRRQWHPTPVLLLGKSHGRRSLMGCSPWDHEESDTTEQLHFHFSLSCIGDGNGNPLQCSCLENPRDGGAWWAAIYGVTQSRTRLKQLSSSRDQYTGGTEKQWKPEENGIIFLKYENNNKIINNNDSLKYYLQ